MNSVLIGIFSYNEGVNLDRVVRSIIQQTAAIDREIMLLDDSTEPFSIKIVSELILEYDLSSKERSEIRKGKAAAMNFLYHYFINSRHSILLHFDADLLLDDQIVFNLIAAIQEGKDLVTGISVPLKGDGIFSCSLSLIAQVFDTSYLNDKSRLPLVGHFGGYSRKAVDIIFPIPERIVEDMYVLKKAIDYNLIAEVRRDCIGYFGLPSQLDDYLANIRRNTGGNKAFFLTFSSEHIFRLNSKFSTLTETRINKDNLVKALLFALRRPLLFLTVPWLVLIRILVGHFSRPYFSPILNTISSSKRLEP